MSNHSRQAWPWRPGAWALLACSALTSPLSAWGASSPTAALPAGAPVTELRYHGIAYATGGISPAEAAQFRARSGDYPLALELIEKQAGNEKHDEFTASARVRIERAGKTLFDARAAGPFMLVQLQPGTYSVTATLGGSKLHKSDVRVAKGRTTRETFEFPARTD